MDREKDRSDSRRKDSLSDQYHHPSVHGPNDVATAGPHRRRRETPDIAEIPIARKPPPPQVSNGTTTVNAETAITRKPPMPK